MNWKSVCEHGLYKQSCGACRFNIIYDEVRQRNEVASREKNPDEQTEALQIGDIVLVIDWFSVPRSFLGCYGKVVDDMTYSEKVMVQIQSPVDGSGGFSHSAFPSDLKYVGKAVH